MPRWLPNAVTVVRLALIPAVVLAAEAVRTGAAEGTVGLGRLATLILLLALGGSDLLDGWMARRWNLQTQLGAVLDAVADKLAQVSLTAYFAFGAGPPFTRLPGWLFWLLLARDLLLGGTWAAFALRGRRVEVVHRVHGKASSALVFGLLLWAAAGLSQSGLSAAAAGVGAFAAASTVRYLWEGWIRTNRQQAPGA